MNCPICNSSHSVNSMFSRGMQRKICLDCRFNFYDSEEYYEKEPDILISGSGSISLRRVFCLKNDISQKDKFSFCLSKNEFKLIYDSEGLEVTTLQAGGMGFSRNTHFVNILRTITNIKKGQSSFFKLRKIKNGYKMEEIEYNNVSKRHRIKKSSEKAFLTFIEKTSYLRFSKGAILYLDLSSYSFVRVLKENGKLYIIPDDKKGFPMKIIAGDYYLGRVFSDFLKEFYENEKLKRFKIEQVELNNTVLYELMPI